MSIAENAQQLIGLAEQIVPENIGLINAAAEALEAAQQGFTQVQQNAEASTQQAAQLLGEGHAGLGAINGSASAIVEKINELQGLINAVRPAISDLDARLLEHADNMRTAANQALGGGR